MAFQKRKATAAAAAAAAAFVNHHKSGTGYAGDDVNDKARRDAGRKKAQAQETHEAQRHLWTLDQEIARFQNKNKTDPPPTESLLILLRQVLRNFGIPVPPPQQELARKNMDRTLQLVEHILENHPKSVGNYFLSGGGDDSLLLALQDAAKTLLLQQLDPASHSTSATTTAAAATAGDGGPLEPQARTLLDLFSRAKTISQTIHEAPDIILVADSNENYRQALRPHAFAFCEEFNGHYYYSQKKAPSTAAAAAAARVPKSKSHRPANTTSSSTSSMGSAAQRKQLFQEISSYQTNLPIEFGSSILVRAMEGSMDHLRVLIFGPQDTPYENGCFFFDLFLQDYPRVPPKCQFLTTGGGKYRFNPNLYNDGKVCLSLLGTWAGPSWQPNESTLYQLLISIQSLILGESEPYFNEPGYASRRNTAHGKGASQRYNQTIRNYTCAAAIWPYLQASNKEVATATTTDPFPYPEFQEAIHLHFRLKQSHIIAQLQRWMNETPKTNGVLLPSTSLQQCLNLLVSRSLLADHSSVMIVSGPSPSATNHEDTATTATGNNRANKRRRMMALSLSNTEPGTNKDSLPTTSTAVPIVISIYLDNDQKETLPTTELPHQTADDGNERQLQQLGLAAPESGVGGNANRMEGGTKAQQPLETASTGSSTSSERQKTNFVPNMPGAACKSSTPNVPLVISIDLDDDDDDEGDKNVPVVISIDLDDDDDESDLQQVIPHSVTNASRTTASACKRTFEVMAANEETRGNNDQKLPFQYEAGPKRGDNDDNGNQEELQWKIPNSMPAVSSSMTRTKPTDSVDAQRTGQGKNTLPLEATDVVIFLDSSDEE